MAKCLVSPAPALDNCVSPLRRGRTLPDLAMDGRLLREGSLVIRRWVSRCFCWAASLGAILSLYTGTARAQYMYLDVNGDGVNDSSDLLTSTTTSVDVWLQTDRNRDGSTVVCTRSDNLFGINSYEIILRASGAIAWGAWTDRMNLSVNARAESATDLYIYRAAPFTHPPGTYRLGTLAISGIGSTTTLDIVSATNAQPGGYTSFGSPCEGSDFDNLLKLGVDWFDVSGVQHGCVESPPGNALPVLSAPATVSGVAGAAVEIQATATDADAGTNLTVTVSGAPASLTLSGNAGSASVTARLSGFLGVNEAGSYMIRWTASDESCGIDTATTLLTVAPPDRPPVVSAPVAVNAVENAEMAFTATASDPDGDDIESITAVFLPAGATFLANASKTAGVFTWTPDYSQAGTYRVEISAESNCRTVTIGGEPLTTCVRSGVTTTIVVAEADQSPVVYAPAHLEGEEDVPLSIRIEANDADGDPITTLAAAPLPPGATFTVGADQASGVLEWTPARGAAGLHDVTFTASNALQASATTVITVRPGADRLPVVTAPASVRGTEGVALAFTATASDPDGDAIESLVAAPLPAGATFSVDPAATSGLFEWTPALGQSGTYVVQLSAESACRPSGISGAVICARGAATTAITVTAAAQEVAASAFVTNANRVIRLHSGKPAWCAQVEPVNGSYENSGVDLASLSLSYGGARISAVAAKTSAAGDKNGNGVEELTACFAKEDLRALLAGLPHGGSTVDVALEGRLFTGEGIHADLAIRVVVTGPALSAAISPNPMNPEALLTFVTSRAGWARISLFDLQGRLARRLVDAGALGAGFHQIRVDGLREDGSRLPSGVYFYRVETSEGTALGRVVIAK